jgi:hypothetical protein
MSDVFRHRSGRGKSYCRTKFDVGSERVKVCEVKRLRYVVKHYFRICMEGMRNTTIIFIEDSKFLVRNFKQGNFYIRSKNSDYSNVNFSLTVYSRVATEFIDEFRV